MDLFEKQAQLTQLFQTSPVDVAYASGSASARKLAGSFNDLDVGLLLLDKIKTTEYFDYQVYFVSELSKALETSDLDVVILNNASLLQRAQVINTWSLLFQRDQRRRVQFAARTTMEYLEFKKYDELQSKALAERVRGERFAVDEEYVRTRLVRLREYLGLLHNLKGVDRVKFKGDPKLYGLAQWYLQQAVELTFGTGAYLIAALALPQPEAYHDILDASPRTASSTGSWRIVWSTSPTFATCSRTTGSRRTSMRCTGICRRGSTISPPSPIRSTSPWRSRSHSVTPMASGTTTAQPKFRLPSEAGLTDREAEQGARAPRSRAERG